MMVFMALTLLLLSVKLSHSCDSEGQTLICRDVPSYFSPGYMTLIMYLSNAGKINSTVFGSENLTSVTKFKMENAGVTGIAEGAFRSFQNLTRLSLMKNALKHMNSNWFSRPAILSELILTENQIEVVNESTFNGLVNLTVLRLNKNTIRSIGPNAFSSQSSLVELDLSENEMTRVSPEVFRPLGSIMMRLDGNPWDCSCGSEDSVDFLKEQILLNRLEKVTCESPPPLRGRPVQNVSVCASSPPPGPSGSQSAPPEHTDALTTVAASSVEPPSETSVQPKPPDVTTTVTLKTATSPPSPPPPQTGSVHTKPSDIPTAVSLLTEVTNTCVTSEAAANTNAVCTLSVVIVVLLVLLFVVCFLLVLHRRQRNNKTVIPQRPKEDENNLEKDGGSSPDHSPGLSEKNDAESFAGVRAKSANAVLLTSSFCVSGKDQVIVRNETEAPPEDTESKAEGQQKLVNTTEAKVGTEHLQTSDKIQKNEKQADSCRDLGQNLQCETAPYLSIGSNPDPNKQSTDSSGQRSLGGKVMGRISTWPPTAIQWQARCKMVEESSSDAFTGWRPNKTSSGEVKKTINNVEPLCGSHLDHKRDRSERNQGLPTAEHHIMNEAHVELRCTSLSTAPSHKETSLKEQLAEDKTTGRRAISETPNPDFKPAHKPTSSCHNKAEQRNEANRAAASKQRGENRSTGSKAPSGGASPHNDTLLSMDLLHEVVQNNGRWTRERWKQMHINKQRR